MKRRLLIVVVVFCVVHSIAEGNEARHHELSAEQFDQFIELLGSIRTSEIGISLSEEQLEQVDLAVAELRSQRAKIQSGGVYKLSPPDEAVKKLATLKRGHEWKKLSESEKHELDEAISEMGDLRVRRESLDCRVCENRFPSSPDATAQPFHSTTNAPVRRTIRFIPKNQPRR